MNLSLTLPDWTVFTIVLVLSLVYGLYMAYKNKASENSSNFFLGGRRMSWPIIGASLFATNIGAEHLVGLSGDAYRYGLSAGHVEVMTVIPIGIAVALLFPYYMKNKIFTIPEFLELRFTEHARTLFSGFMIIISVMTKLAFTVFAGALVLHSLLGWDIMSTVIWIAIIVAIFTIMGGYTAVAYTGTIQVVIMIIGGIVMVSVGLYQVGGWGALMEKAPDMMRIAKPYNDPIYPFWGILATAFYAGVFYWGIDQVNVQRVLAAPDIQTARKGSMFAILLKLLPVFLFALPGVIAFALFPGELEGEASKHTFVLLLNKLLPVGLRGLLLAALLAALISSLIAVFNRLTPSPVFELTGMISAFSRKEPFTASRTSSVTSSTISSSTMSILVITTMPDFTPKRRHISKCSRVCGIIDSSAATTSSTKSMPPTPASIFFTNFS